MVQYFGLWQNACKTNDKSISLFKNNLFPLSIQYKHPRRNLELGKTEHSGLEFHTLQPDIGLPLKLTPDSLNWQSHLLYLFSQQQSCRGLCAQSPPAHPAHPWLHDHTWRKYADDTTIVERFLITTNNLAERDRQRAIYRSTSAKPRSWLIILVSTICGLQFVGCPFVLVSMLMLASTPSHSCQHQRRPLALLLAVVL